MQKYRYLWGMTTRVLAALGLVAAAAAWPVVAALSFVLVATAVGAGTASFLTESGSGLPWRRAATSGGRAASLMVASGGLIDLFGTWGFVLVVAVAISSPPLVSGVLAWCGEDGAPTAVPAESLDDEALYLAWRTSCEELRRSASAAEGLAVVQRRQELLDEIARRNVSDLSAWL